MFLCDYFVFLVASYLFSHIMGKCNGYYYFTLENSKNRKYSITPMKIMGAKSKIDCCRKCESILRCTSVNYMKSSKECEILNGIPVLPSHLTQQEDATYIEKGCHQSSVITSASSANNTEYLSVLVDVYNGKHKINLVFGSSFRVSGISLSDGVSQRTQNTVKDVRSVGNVQRINGDIIILYVNGQNMVFRYVNGVSSTDGWPKHISSVFGLSQVSALLPTLSQTGVYVFAYDTVSEFSTSDWETFTHTSSYNLDIPNVSNPWINAPKGIVGAAWLYPSSGSPRYTFLTTTRNYVIYDTKTHVTVDRGQICMQKS